MLKVFIVGGDLLIARMFAVRGWTMADLPENADLLCFTGGVDVSPEYYGHAVHPTTRNNPQRDAVENRIFNLYRDMPKVGICRGSQFLNVLSGGTLWQDVDNHAIGGTHSLFYLPDGKYNYDRIKIDDEGDEHDLNEGYETIKVTSTHHQMMRPAKDRSELWGWASRSNYRDLGGQKQKRTDRSFSPDVEIVWYPETKSMCFQAHPEYGVKSCEDLFFRCVDRAFPQFAIKSAGVAAAA